MNEPRLLIAGIGNIFMGDDAFGSEVAQRLGRRKLPDAVRVIDFGIRGLDLSYAMLDGYEVVILVDATPRGGTPGTLYLIEPESEAAESQLATSLGAIDSHGMNPVKALRLAREMGGHPGRILLVGCEPEPIAADDEGRMGLSEPVGRAVDQAVEMILSQVERLLESLPALAKGDGKATE